MVLKWAFWKISHQTEKVIGQIVKNWRGLGTELFTDADTFGVDFPVDLHVKDGFIDAYRNSEVSYVWKPW